MRLTYRRRFPPLGPAFPFPAWFNMPRTDDPNKADTLFSPGIVEWQGKKVGLGAVAAWKKLLATNSAYPEKGAVLRLLAWAQQC